MMGNANANLNDESDLITLADIEIEEKSKDDLDCSHHHHAGADNSIIIGLEQEMYLESRRQASTVMGVPTHTTPGARLNNYIIDEEGEMSDKNEPAQPEQEENGA